jgi:TolA-binding protein
VVFHFLPALFLTVFSGTIRAQQADPCGGLVGTALGQCRGDQQKFQQQELDQLQQQIRQQQERQKQLDEQQRQIQQQLENMRLQNEALRKQLAQEKSANQPAQPAAMDHSATPEHHSTAPEYQSATPEKHSTTPEITSWKSDNPWFGSDYAKTEFAMRYAKQLQQERPDLVGRPFLDALSAKVNETFGTKR